MGQSRTNRVKGPLLKFSPNGNTRSYAAFIQCSLYSFDQNINTALNEFISLIIAFFLKKTWNNFWIYKL